MSDHSSHGATRIDLGITGSRLINAVIRDGHLYTCQHAAELLIVASAAALLCAPRSRISYAAPKSHITAEAGLAPEPIPRPTAAGRAWPG